MCYLRFLMTLTTTIYIFWDVTPCSLVDKQMCAVYSFKPKEGKYTPSTFLWNAVTNPPQYMATHPTRQWPSLQLKHYMQIELTIWIQTVQKIFMFSDYFVWTNFVIMWHWQHRIICEICDSHSGGTFQKHPSKKLRPTSCGGVKFPKEIVMFLYIYIATYLSLCDDCWSIPASMNPNFCHI